MKKTFVIISVFALALTFSTFAKAADDNFHMNVRFMQTDAQDTNLNPVRGAPEARMSLHVVELKAATEVDNIGGAVIYRLNDERAEVTNDSSQSYPVNAYVYVKGGPHKFTAGLQFVPFAIYKWNNLYNPFLDLPGQQGLIWDFDWGYLYTYDEKPVKLDIGYWDNEGGNFMENAEKNTITLRLGYDILSNWNLGVSYMDGNEDLDGDSTALTDRSAWAIDTTWKPLSNLQIQAEYVDYDKDDEETGVGNDMDGDLGLLQVKYDIVKVPAPLNKISLVVQYSWLDQSVGNLSLGKTKNYQEEIWLQVAKNCHIFWQNRQEKYPSDWGQDTAKDHVLAIKYNLF